MPKKEKGQIAYQFVKDNPTATPSEIAEMMLMKHKTLFASKEQARGFVRVYMGRSGVKKREIVKANEGFRPIGKFNLPPEEANEWKPIILPKVNNNIGFMADIHFPLQDNRAIDMALEYCISKGMNTLILGGDIIDNSATCFFPHSPQVKNIRYEIDCAKAFFEGLKHSIPNVKIYYLFGNHEERLQKYVWSHADKLDTLDELKLENLLGLVNFNIIPVLYQNRIEVGELDIVHGHEFGKGGGGEIVNLSRRMFNKTNHNTLFGHYHRTDIFMQSNSRGKTTGCWSVGCSCDLHPAYSRQNRWNLGFAHVESYKDGTFSIENKTILKHNDSGDKKIDYKIC